MTDATPHPAFVAWDRMKLGEEVVMSDEIFDVLAQHFEAQDGPEADIWFSHVSSRPNPQRVGTLDVYAVKVTEIGLKRLVEDGIVEGPARTKAHTPSP